MRITSDLFEEGGKIPARYTCDGEGISPPLEFHDLPAGALSLVLLMDDPDVPPSVRSDRMWDHWVVFNIPPSTRRVKEGVAPHGILGAGTGGDCCYMGPCPPDREHRYYFKLYALDCMLSLGKGATKKEVQEAMHGHILAEAHLMGRYERP